jgi:hypothetical protein
MNGRVKKEERNVGAKTELWGRGRRHYVKVETAYFLFEFFQALHAVPSKQDRMSLKMLRR